MTGERRRHSGQLETAAWLNQINDWIPFGPLRRVDERRQPRRVPNADRAANPNLPCRVEATDVNSLHHCPLRERLLPENAPDRVLARDGDANQVLRLRRWKRVQDTQQTAGVEILGFHPAQVRP